MNARSFFIFLFSAVLFPIIIMYTVYFGFVTGYAEDVFSRATFKRQYDQDVYRYRIFSKALLFPLHDVVSRADSIFDKKIDSGHEDKYADWNKAEDRRIVLFIDKEGDVVFYKSLFLLNTIFMVMTTVLAYFLFKDNRFFNLSSLEGASLNLVLAFIIGITQFSVNPYDCSAYFFLVSAIYISLLYVNNPLPRHLFWFCVLTSIAAMNRETAALGLSFFATVSISRFGLKQIRPYLAILLPLFCYLCIYIVLRLIYGFEHATHHDMVLLLNLRFFHRNISGFAFWLTAIGLFVALAKAYNRRLIFHFLAFSLPYIVMVWYAAYIFESRLAVPLVIGSLFLSPLENFGLRLQENNGQRETL
ncbi:MAG: hypothetical protein HZA15_05030 [Nitrospirae bacterium]|nr:hypothetical protein [Nitrospirota bacterium]